MSRIVDGNRRVALRGDTVRKPGNWSRRRYSANPAKGSDVAVHGPREIAKTEAELALVREHFGVNVSRAFRIALHLTANAIRKNRATPEV